MKTRVQGKMIGLVLAIVLMGLGICFLTLKSQWQEDELRTQMKRVDSESFRVADQFRDFLRELDNSLYHWGRSRVAPDLKAFARTSDELNQWIDHQKPNLSTDREKAILQRMDHAYDDYLRAAKELLARLVANGDASANIDEYDGVRQESQRLADLGQELSRAHFMSRDQVQVRMNHAISQLHLIELLSLGLLFLFAVALTFFVYRDMILPLRVKLVESESLRERQEKLASLGVLAAGVAHEIRNPLTAIKAALFIQQKKFQPGTQEAADAKIIDREILRLERIVNDFLLFARPGDSKLASVSVDAPLRDVHALLAPELAKDNIQLVLSDAPPLVTIADTDQLKQVLINLVRNAAEATEKGGIVKLRARSDRKYLDKKDTRVVVLEVVDNGKGMPPEVQKRLFDPFFTTKETGTGLGLSIAARIVHRHGGLLEYQTAPGAGTTFSIVLPAAPNQSPTRAG